MSAVARRRLYACLAAALPLTAFGYDGRVVEVSSGHALVVLTDQHRLAVRLAGIESPTGRERYAIAARQSLIALCGGEAVRVELQAGSAAGTGTGGTGTKTRRATVACNGRDAAAEQLRRGMAVLVAGEAHPPALEQAQAEAQAAKRGVWAPRTDATAERR